MSDARPAAERLSMLCARFLVACALPAGKGRRAGGTNAGRRNDGLCLDTRIRDEDWSLACALNALGYVLLYQGDYAQTQDMFERATALFKKAGDLWLYGEMHLRLADVYLAQGDERKGRALLDERVAIHVQADNSWATGWFLSLFGQIALRQGAIARARILLEAGW